VVVEVVVVVVVVVVDDPNFPFTQTRFPTRKNDSADAPFNRYNVGSPNPNRTASRDHESFGNAIWNFAHDLIGCQESDAKTRKPQSPQPKPGSIETWALQYQKYVISYKKY
jgi:hypothetical protein